MLRPRTLLPFLAGIFLCRPVVAEELQAGAAIVEITPPVGDAMWGYAARKDAPSTGVRDPLKARALVLGVGKERLALVSLDLGRAPTRASMDAIRAKVKAGGVGNVLVVASHMHHGPVIELDNWPTPKRSYVRQLEDKLADIILMANKNLRPARRGVEGSGARGPRLAACASR
jgi:hypothetical protein